MLFQVAPTGGVRRIAIVTPVLDDWKSLEKLIGEIGAIPEVEHDHITIVAVDDGSKHFHRPPNELIVGAIRRIVVVRLKANQSHQRAIALGLAYVYRESLADVVIVMDSDGEDRPQELPKLLQAHDKSKDAIIVARRRKRSEGSRFQAGYFVYKMLFSALTGKHISFGNFCLLPGSKLKNVLFNANIWNNFAATILRSRVPLEFVATDRGKRYFGASKMSFTSLVVHGMSAISVFSDLVISRMIVALAASLVLFVMAVVGVFVGKFIVDYYQIPGYFVPGYATSLILSLTNMLISSMFVGLMIVLTLLTARTQISALPTRLFDDIVDEIEIVSAPVSRRELR